MTRTRALLRALIPALALLSACATVAPLGTIRTVGAGDLQLSERLTAARAALQQFPEAPLYGTELSRGSDASTHLVVVRTRESYHLHAQSDIVGVVMAGQGYLETDGGRRDAVAGDVLLIPRGQPHAFVNTGSDVAVLYAVFTPPFVDGDRMPVTAPSAPAE